jgi:co-chaperonin GroES (HSP10)
VGGWRVPIDNTIQSGIGWLAHRTDVSKSDTVLYVKYTGTEIKIENKKYLILKETVVLTTVQ